MPRAACALAGSSCLVKLRRRRIAATPNSGAKVVQERMPLIA
jgi:hypothetical protein